MATITNASKQSASDVITETGTNFKLNEAQLKAFQIITSHFIASYVNNEVDAEPVKHLVMLLTGPGGTGKTHIVKAIQAVMRHYGCAHLIRFLAPTGSAAALIDGMTVHKGLRLKIKSLNKGKGNHQPGCATEDYSVLISVQNRTQLHEEWKNVKYLLIDEVSLLSLQLLVQIDHALRYAKEKPDQWFGGVHLMFAGDFYQFPPVGGSTLYCPIAAYAGQSDAEIQKRLGRLAWKTLNIVITLSKQERMKGDIEYGLAVNQLRVRKCMEEDVELFNSRLMKTSTNPDGMDLTPVSTADGTAIVTTNEIHKLLNVRKLQAISGESLVICAAVDKSCKEISLEMRRNLLQLNVTALKASRALPGFTTLAVGMPIIL